MEIITSLEQLNISKPTVVALGNFDGVHIGHQQILTDAVRRAREQDALAVCYTFSNHTRSNVRLICTEEEKLAMLEKLGIDLVANLEFNEEIRNTPAEVFIRDVLSKQLKAVGVCCGFNYRFGAKAAGNAALLESAGAQYGITAYVHDAVYAGDEVVSSTYVRKMIEMGDLEKVSYCLGRNYAMQGTVLHGNHLGTVIGFPTANILYDPDMMAPPNGVYFTYAVLDGCKYPAVTNIGVKPTIGAGYAKSIETHIYDYSRDLYGENIIVEFLLFERAEMRFDSVEALKDQIAEDYRLGKRYHGI
ncbi:MAG: bifunctional riboflavin kinase/FAD synthetase [Mogibacterium sp.]|nr:bifunctional riboflavin kinase/FAD synthetase [Mogibacterium sp.]